MKKQFFLPVLFLFFLAGRASAQSVAEADSILPIFDTVEIKVPELTLDELVKLKNCIEFPDLLKGHEEEALPYIEGFAKRRKEYLIRTYSRDQQFSKKILPIISVALLVKHIQLVMILFFEIL
ncbi:MAG: hypothetical protein HYR66_05390 [Sphingobacteriales bacterium]|nr:hypothetical protein [Sphingobacteriales bacterium]MBI3718999.1 hypothetical protein [Sphingobacteriales bacterium]